MNRTQSKRKLPAEDSNAATSRKRQKVNSKETNKKPRWAKRMFSESFP